MFMWSKAELLFKLNSLQQRYPWQPAAICSIDLHEKEFLPGADDLLCRAKSTGVMLSEMSPAKNITQHFSFKGSKYNTEYILYLTLLLK